MLGGEQVYQTRVTKHLVPCIAQFSVAMGDDSQWKVLNYQILLKTRHSCPKVTGENRRTLPVVTQLLITLNCCQM